MYIFIENQSGSFHVFFSLGWLWCTFLTGFGFSVFQDVEDFMSYKHMTHMFICFYWIIILCFSFAFFSISAANEDCSSIPSFIYLSSDWNKSYLSEVLEIISEIMNSHSGMLMICNLKQWFISTIAVKMKAF